MNEWIKITDDPATLPDFGRLVIIRNEWGLENFGCRLGYHHNFLRLWGNLAHNQEWRWYCSTKAIWSERDQSICGENLRELLRHREFIPPTHWRPI